MQKLILTLIILSSTLLAAQQQDTTYILDTENSVINWTGIYAFQFSEHSGTVQFKEGQLYTTGSTITGGEFIIDMTTIDNEDNKSGKGPVGHLKNEDFFDVAKYPEAHLKIRTIEYFENTNTHEVFADFTIKGITKSQKFYATADGTTNTLTTQFKIDRTRWGITYNNKMKDHAISDAVGFDVRLVFKQ